MKNLRTMILIGALLMTAAAPSFAEEAHHPAGSIAEAPAVSPTPGAQPGMMGMPGGMMSGGMMGPGMMSMMGHMAPMMAPARIEGLIAFLRTELKITDAQQPQWNAFAEVLRAHARAAAGMMKEMQGAMMPSQTPTAGSLPQRIDLHERMLAARLDGLRQMKAALLPLYATFDEAQRRTADELIPAGPMGHM